MEDHVDTRTPTIYIILSGKLENRTYCNVPTTLLARLTYLPKILTYIIYSYYRPIL